jgi:hypothetical protein
MEYLMIAHSSIGLFLIFHAYNRYPETDLKTAAVMFFLWPVIMPVAMWQTWQINRRRRRG